MSGDWQVWHSGQISGPFALEALRAAASAGEITRGARVRPAPEAPWRPLEEVIGADAVAAGSPHPSSERLAMIAVGVICAAVMLFAGLLIFTRRLDHLTIEHDGLWTAVAGVGFVSLGAAATLMWRWAGRLKQRAAEAAGALRIATVMLFIGGATIFSLLAWLGPDASASTAARAAYRTYRFDYLPEDRTLTVVGSIGPGLDARLARELRDRDVERIEITSNGGLIWEAWRAARMIERAKLTVVARRQCDSACLLLLMAGDRREADYDMVLGFHAAAPLTEADQSDVAAADEVADNYLVRRGVPRPIVERAQALGPQRLYYVPTVDLIRTDALHALMDGDRLIGEAQARSMLAMEAE